MNPLGMWSITNHDAGKLPMKCLLQLIICLRLHIQTNSPTTVYQPFHIIVLSEKMRVAKIHQLISIYLNIAIKRKAWPIFRNTYRQIYFFFNNSHWIYPPISYQCPVKYPIHNIPFWKATRYFRVVGTLLLAPLLTAPPDHWMVSCCASQYQLTKYHQISPATFRLYSSCGYISQMLHVWNIYQHFTPKMAQM